MRINTQLRVTSYVTAVALIIMIPLLGWGFLEFNQAQSNYVLAETTHRQYVERSSLRNQYFLYYNQYVLEQLDAEQQQTEALLGRAVLQFSGSIDQKQLRELPTLVEKVDTIFRRIVENHERMTTSEVEQRVVYAELEKRLISQLLLKVTEIDQGFRALLNHAANRIQQDYERLVVIAIVFTIVMAATIIVFVSRLSRMISRRLVSLHEGAESVAQGDLSYRIDERGKDEFSELAQSINLMTGNLQTFTQQLESEIQVRKDTEEELTRAKLSAEVANSAKSQFLSRMSHELRTPLNAIIGFAQLQQNRFSDSTPENERRGTEHIHEAGLHLLMLVDDIMDIVRIEQRQLHISLEALKPTDAIEESVSLVRLQADTSGVELIVEPTELWIVANHNRLKQVLVNLLSNAIKYNTRGGSVRVRTCDVGSDRVEIRITDTGVGIRAEDYEAIFEPFTRLKYAEAQEIQGTGIGLALSKFLVEQMKGQIGVDGTTAGEGATFWIRFPKGEASAPAPSIDTVRTTQSRTTQTAHTIVYIEDNPASRELVQTFLQGFPEFTLLLAESAEAGIRIAQESVPDVILVDINLPGMDGIAAVGQLKAMPVLNNTRLVAVSADALPHQVEKAMESGFEAYLTKPFRLDDLVEVILGN